MLCYCHLPVLLRGGRPPLNRCLMLDCTIKINSSQLWQLVEGDSQLLLYSPRQLAGTEGEVNNKMLQQIISDH